MELVGTVVELWTDANTVIGRHSVGCRAFSLARRLEAPVLAEVGPEKPLENLCHFPRRPLG